MTLQSIAKENRTPDTSINEIFYTRWSPRAMTGETMSKEELMPLFEAARWAPSSYNGQPWHFVVATGEKKDEFLSFLVEFNQQWCKNAAALVVILSQNNFAYNGKPNAHHSFDTGSAWMSLSLEGAKRGLVIHGMAGFDKEKVKATLNIPDTFTVEAMCAIGKFADKSTLPEAMQEKEKPSQRKKVEEFVNWEGEFRWE